MKLAMQSGGNSYEKRKTILLVALLTFPWRRAAAIRRKIVRNPKRLGANHRHRLLKHLFPSRRNQRLFQGSQRKRVPAPIGWWAYFSYAENADLPDGVDASATASIQAWNGETTGNTGVIAAMIAEATGADLFSIQTVEKYPDSYDATIDQGQEELNADARPELAVHLPEP